MVYLKLKPTKSLLLAISANPPRTLLFLLPSTTQLQAKDLNQTNASPTKTSISDGEQSDNDMDPATQSQQDETTQDQPSASRSPLTDVISHGDSCGKDANSERAQEPESHQEIVDCKCASRRMIANTC